MKKFHLNSSEHSWVSDYLDTIPEEYFREFGDYLCGTYFPGVKFNVDYSEEWHRKEFDFQLHVRMQQAELVFMPWINESIDLAGKNILEIGCGTGSSTVAIAKRANKVIGCDISKDSLSANQKRLECMKITNVDYFKLNDNWLTTPNVELPVDLSNINVVVCYALLEHLLIEERLNLLSYLWKNLKSESILITFETPNRLASIDWHTSQTLFAQILPDNLCAHYYSRSNANNLKFIAKNQYSQLNSKEIESVYRLGVGVSFHEFELAIGFPNMKIINDGFSINLKHHRDQLSVGAEDYENALGEILVKSSLSIPRGFAKASLDFIIQKL